MHIPLSGLLGKLPNALLMGLLILLRPDHPNFILLSKLFQILRGVLCVFSSSPPSQTHTELTWAQNPRQAHYAIFRRLTQFSWEYPGFWHPAHIYRSALELLGSQHYWTHTGLIDSPETWKSKHKHEIDIDRHRSVISYGQKRKKTCFFPPPFNII